MNQHLVVPPIVLTPEQLEIINNRNPDQEIVTDVNSDEENNVDAQDAPNNNFGRYIKMIFKCHICDKELSTVTSLRNHIRAKHHIVLAPIARGNLRAEFQGNDVMIGRGFEFDVKRYRCPLCHLSFITFARERNHVITH